MSTSTLPLFRDQIPAIVAEETSAPTADRR